MATSLEHRIAALTDLSANLIAELSELNRLREQVRKAQLAARKSIYQAEKPARARRGLLGRDRGQSATLAPQRSPWNAHAERLPQAGASILIAPRVR